MRFVERFIFEAVLKCVEADRAAREASDVSGEPPVNIAQRTELTAQAAKLQRKLRTAKDDFNDGEIHEDEYERRREDIKGAMAGIELKLSSIRKEERKVKQTIPVKTMRERMYAEPEFAASTVDEVLDHFVLMPVGRERRVEDAITLVWREGLTPPSDKQLQKLRDDAREEREHLYLLDLADKHAEVSREVADRCYDLWQRDYGNREIAAMLDADGVPTAHGGPWTGETVLGVVRRECRRHKVEYVTKHAYCGKVKFPPETRAFVHELCRDKGRRYADIAESLKGMAYATPDGTPWTKGKVRALDISESARRGQALGRRRTVPFALIQQVAGLRGSGMSVKEIVAWLGPERHNIPRPAGGAWDEQGVYYLLRRWEEHVAISAS